MFAVRIGAGPGVEEVVPGSHQRLEIGGGAVEAVSGWGGRQLPGEMAQCVGDSAGGAVAERVDASGLDPFAAADGVPLQGGEGVDGEAQGGGVGRVDFYFEAIVFHLGCVSQRLSGWQFGTAAPLRPEREGLVGRDDRT